MELFLFPVGPSPGFSASSDNMTSEDLSLSLSWAEATILSFVASKLTKLSVRESCYCSFALMSHCGSLNTA